MSDLNTRRRDSPPELTPFNAHELTLRHPLKGSNPNDGVSSTTYRTRYEVEMFSPPYFSASVIRPNYSGLPSNILYGATYTLGINVLSNAKVVQAVIMDLGE